MLYKNDFLHQIMQAWGKCSKRHASLLVDMNDNHVGDHSIESLFELLRKYWSHQTCVVHSVLHCVAAAIMMLQQLLDVI